MNRRMLGTVMVVCGFFLSINGKLTTGPRGLGILLAIAGVVLMIIKSGRTRGTCKK